MGVTWDAATDATAYRVERKQTADWQDISGSLTSTTTTWIDETIAAGATADYRVVATSDTESATSPELHATRVDEAPAVGDIDVLALDANRGGGTTWLQNETAGPVTASAPANGSRTLTAGSLKLRIPAYFAGPGYYNLNTPNAVTLTQGDRSCDSAATFRVSAVTYTADGQLETFAASLAAGTCSGAAPVAWYEIRYRSAAGYQALSVTPDTLDAGRVPVGTSKALTLTLKNTGTEQITFGTMTLNVTNPWTVARDCGQTLAAGASCQLTITFSPPSPGDWSARLTIQDSTALSTHQVLMTAVATSLPVAPGQPGLARMYSGLTLVWPTWKLEGGTPVKGYFVHRYVDGGETTTFVDNNPNLGQTSWTDSEPKAGTQYALSAVNEIGEGPVGPRATVQRATEQLVLTNGVDKELTTAGVSGYGVSQGLYNGLPRGAVAASPDGRTIAFVTVGFEKSLWTQTVAPDGAGTPVKLWTPDVPLTHLAWSPDGTRIAFQAPENGTPCVYVIAAAGGTPQKVACDLTSPSWMPDARTLVVVDRRLEPDRFARVNAAAGGARLATLPAPIAAADGKPVRVSPDGRTVAFGDGQTVKYVGFGTDKVLTSPPLGGDVHGISWDPDGRILLAAVGSRLIRLDVQSPTLMQALPGQPLGGELDVAWQRLGPTIAALPAVVGSQTSIAFDGSALLPGTTYTCTVTGGTPAPCTSPFTVSGLRTGEYSLTVTASEPDGRVTTRSRTFSVDASGPVARVTGPNYQSSVAATTRVTVAASDPTNVAPAIGVASYDVRYRRATSAGAYSAYVQPWTGITATSVDVAVAAGYEYCFSVRAKDKLGNVGDWSAERCFSRPLDDRSLSMATTGWARGSSSKFYYGTDTQTTASGKALTRTVQGKRFFLIATRCPSCGTVAVYAGNKLLTTLNLAYPTTHYQVVLGLPVQSTLFSGTLTVRTVSTGRLVQIDGLAVGRS
ncbi:MAG: choice-of-anchor D domain-containing protein [Kribbellaceae bacterium]|nr:choice-of-anchor D domain-containing protein [Kribbellaceae bacterium]